MGKTLRDSNRLAEKLPRQTRNRSEATMIVRRHGGMTEFIPSVREKREGLIHDHILELAGLLHERLSLIEEAQNQDPKAAERCHHLLECVRSEEKRIHEITRELAMMDHKQ
jgi:hypothetical protein